MAQKTVIHLPLMLHHYTPWKRKKNRGFLTISAGNIGNIVTFQR